ncbi:hypothetical protein DKX38_020273 [Salix brachista]|uniref:Uncharacterized protein n=1 Tax=Salix brachista TaxID=2182728 RepID=A0A5N5KIK6_9ROSI|nr:hypothetical protein DKX38_020273 [Salix brachista]
MRFYSSRQRIKLGAMYNFSYTTSLPVPYRTYLIVLRRCILLDDQQAKTMAQITAEADYIDAAATGGNLLPVPAHVPRGLLTVWNWEEDRNVGTTWNFTNSDLSPSLRVLRVPDLSSENALSVGAKMVKPELESLSAENKWFSSWVDLKRRIKIVKWPTYSQGFW